MGIVIRQSLKGTAVNYLGVVLGIFVQFVVVTRFLEPEVLGLTQVIYNVALIFSTLCLMGATSSGMRFFPYFKDRGTGDHGFLFYYVLLPVVGCLVFVPLYCLLRAPVCDYFGRQSPQFNDFFYWVIPLMVILAFWTWSETYANIHMRIAVPKAVREIGMRLFLLVAYVAYALGWVGVAGMIVLIFAGYGLCMLATGAYALRIGTSSLRHDWTFLSTDLKRKIGFYTGFLMVSAVAGQVLQFVDIFMLSGLKGLYSTGVYTIVIYMANVVGMPTRSITSIASPLAAQAMKEGDTVAARDHYRQVSLHQFLASALLLLLVWFNLDSIFAIIPNGDIYAEGRWAILLLGLQQVIYGTLNFGNTLISYSRYYWFTLVVTILLTALSVCTNLYFIPRWGLTGAAMATLLTAVLSYTFQQVVVQFFIRTNPFTWAHLRVVCVAALLFGLNALLPSLGGVSPWLDLTVRSLVFVLAGGALVYVLRISPQANRIIDKVLRRDVRHEVGTFVKTEPTLVGGAPRSAEAASGSQEDPYRLHRFVEAQERMYGYALAELQEGRKRLHWMWFIFPQLEHLGHSRNAKFFGISGADEAAAYLAHPVLGARLREVSETLLGLATDDAESIFGTVDARKLRSSMTLFDAVAPGDVFARVLDKYFGGERDGRTLGILQGQSS